MKPLAKTNIEGGTSNSIQVLYVTPSILAHTGIQGKVAVVLLQGFFKKVPELSFIDLN